MFAHRTSSGWQGVLARTAAAVRVVLCTGALLAVTSSTLQTGARAQTVWAADLPAPQVRWTTVMALRFPDCSPDLRVAVPATVIEVDAGGLAERVSFADAWRRTHDRVEGNAGRIVAKCRH